MITRLFLISALALSVVPASADDPAQANKLFVEAVKLIRDASAKQAPDEQLPLLEESLAKLNEIIEKHPSTDLAVKLITGQSVGIISLPELTDEINKLKRQSTRETLAASRSACLESLNVTDPKCAMWLRDIVRAQLQAGDPKAALQAAMTTEEGVARDSLLYDIARHYAQAGNMKEALTIVNSMQTEGARIMARHDIDIDQIAFVSRHLQHGNLQAALTVAESIETTQVRDPALHDIAAAQVRAGNLMDASTTARSIQDSQVRNSVERYISGAQIQVANRQLQAGNIRDTLATAQKIADPAARNQVLGAVAGLQLQAGNIQDALSTTKQMEDPIARDTVLTRIARKQLQSRQLQEASSTAKLMQTPGMRDQIWQELTRLYTQANDLDNALTFANLIDRDDARDIRLNPIAQAKLQAGDIPAVLSIAKSMKTGMRDNVFEEVVKLHTRTGDLTNALAVTKLIGSENARHTRLYYIAQAQLQGGDLQGASSTAELMPDGSFRNEILKAVRERSQ